MNRDVSGQYFIWEKHKLQVRRRRSDKKKDHLSVKEGIYGSPRLAVSYREDLNCGLQDPSRKDRRVTCSVWSSIAV